VQLVKCVAWFPRGLDRFIKLPLSFFIPDLNFHILGASMRSKLVIELFVVKALHEDFEMIFNLLKLVNH
jgi:hypothetical protein